MHAAGVRLQALGMGVVVAVAAAAAVAAAVVVDVDRIHAFPDSDPYKCFSVDDFYLGKINPHPSADV